MKNDYRNVEQADKLYNDSRMANIKDNIIIVYDHEKTMYMFTVFTDAEL